MRSGVGRGWNVLGMPTEHPEYWLATCLTHRNPADMSLPLARRFSYISVDVWESHPSSPLPCLNKVSLVTEARRGEVNNEGDLLLFFFSIFKLFLDQCALRAFKKHPPYRDGIKFFVRKLRKMI